MKTRFKVGDRVRGKYVLRYGVGKVMEVVLYSVRVEWPSGVQRVYDPRDLELYETPIERMKRKYSEG